MPHYHKDFPKQRNGSNFAAKINQIMNVLMKLVALGDSIVKGVLFTQEENGLTHYSFSDRNFIDRVGTYLHSDVVNLGKMGCTIEKGEGILDRHLSSLDGAKYVVMCYGGNDGDYDWKAIANNPTIEHSPKTPLGVFEKTYIRLIRKVRSLGYTPLILTLPPMDAESYYQHITSTFNQQQKQNVRMWLKDSINLIWAGHELYNDAVKRIASLTDSQLIDITTPLGNGNNYLCTDGIHPNLAGQRKIASIINRNIIAD